MTPRVGNRAPAFTAAALAGDGEQMVSLSDFEGRWVVLYFYPKDDTSVCESENVAFRDRHAEFESLGAQLLAASVDSLESHRVWRDHGLGDLPYPWLADPDKKLAERFGVLHGDTGLALRATFIINPDGILKHLSINDAPVGRSLDEVLRTLKALQSGRPTQCNWRPGEPTL